MFALEGQEGATNMSLTDNGLASSSSKASQSVEPSARSLTLGLLPIS